MIKAIINQKRIEVAIFSAVSNIRIRITAKLKVNAIERLKNSVVKNPKTDKATMQEKLNSPI